MENFDVRKIKVVAMDLDGTLSQHKQPLPRENRETLVSLAKKYRLLMVGAGTVVRIFDQLGRFPIDVIGNYGLQYGEYDKISGDIKILRDIKVGADKASAERRVKTIREKYGFTEFKGESVEFHESGAVTFPVLGTKAELKDKLAFDPDRKKRRAIYPEVKAAFPEYSVFVGGSSSFDMAPKPYNKYYALDLFCKEKGFLHSETVFIGDDYGEGGNDESVYLSDFPYIKIDDYRDFPAVAEILLK